MHAEPEAADWQQSPLTLEVLRDPWYERAVIRSWRNAATRKVWGGERPNRFAGLDVDKAQELLVALDAATALSDLSPLRSVGLHKLKGDRRGQWAMSVNGPWRIVFRFRDGDAYEVEITDYHKG